MVDLKQKENCENKRDKRPPSYIGGAKMAKIFATKALSMVLCFVMLFMGAPVTTWATAKTGTIKVFSDAVGGTPVDLSKPFPLDMEGNGTLYVGAYDENEERITDGVTITGSIGDIEFTADADGSLQLTGVTSGGTITISAAKEEYTFANVSFVLGLSSVKIYDYEDMAAENQVESLELPLPVISVQLYAQAFLGDEPVSGATLTWSSDDESVATVSETGVVVLTDSAEDGDTVTITASYGDLASADVTVWVVADDDDDVVVNYVEVKYSDPELGGSVYSLTMFVGDEVDLSADVNTVGDNDNGVTWESSKSSVVSVDADGYDATLTAEAAGTATITVTSVDDDTKTDEIKVTVVDEASVLAGFTPVTSTYNRDLLLRGDAWGRKHMMLGTVTDEAWFSLIESVSISDSSGRVLVASSARIPWSDLVCGAEWSVGAAEGLFEADFLAADLLPVCLNAPGFQESGERLITSLYPGTLTVTFAMTTGDEVTTSINIVENKIYDNATWTKGSSDGLTIAKMLNLTNGLLDDTITDLNITLDGKNFSENWLVSDVLGVESYASGNVFIKKAFLDTLEAGTYSISFMGGNRAEAFTFTVVAADPDPDSDPDSEVRTLSADVTISVGGVAKNQKIMVRDINNILSDDTQLHVEVASEAHDELDVPIFDVEHGFHYNVKLLDAAGDELPMPLSAKVELLFECVEGLDIGQLEIVLADSLTDTQFEEDYQTYGDVQYVGVLTNHFSPYSLLDIQTEDEKAALGKGKNNVKTGDQAVQIAVAGLGSILVLALGIMLRLITSKKKFEE